jgi:hypothetical protein
VIRVGSQEVSKPVMVGIIAAAVLIIGLVGWYFFLRPQPYPGFQAPPGGVSGQGGPGMMPGQTPQPGMMPGQAPGAPR